MQIGSNSKNQIQIRNQNTSEPIDWYSYGRISKIGEIGNDFRNIKR